jgi:hypothetical protein
MTLNEARASGIRRVRDPKWAFVDAYLEIGVGILSGVVFLFSPTEQRLNGFPTPQILSAEIVTWDEDGWEEYAGSIESW